MLLRNHFHTLGTRRIRTKLGAASQDFQLLFTEFSDLISSEFETVFFSDAHNVFL